MDLIIKTLANELNQKEAYIENVVSLLDEGNTIPFIARYRKEAHGAMDDTELRDFHKRLLEGSLPLSIGGGIGQSRLCMILLHKAHIGETQSSIWPCSMREECQAAGMHLI